MSADSVVDLVRQGIVPLEGGLVLKLGATVGAATALLGIDPERPKNQWHEPEGTLGQTWLVKRGFLWWGPGAFPLELTFLNDRLVRVIGPDDRWRSSGASWDDFDPSIEIRNYRASRAFLEERLGTPGETREFGDSLLVAEWPLADSLLTLCWESRTPSLTVSVSRVMPDPL